MTEGAESASQAPSTLGRRGAWTGLVLFVVAAVLRLYYVESVLDDPSVRTPMVDSRAYHERAVEILGGAWASDRIAYQDPLYPYFLAVLYAIFGVGSRFVLFAQALLDAGTVVLVYDIARRLHGWAPAVAAGALAALYEVFFYYDAFLLKIPLSVFLISLALQQLVRAARSSRTLPWLAGGAALGIACLTRGNYLVFVAVAGLYVLARPMRSRNDRLRDALAYALGVLAVLVPIASYNYALAGDFVLVTSQAGQNFYTGNHRGNDTGGYLAPPFVRANPAFEEVDFRTEAERRTGRSMRPSELSRFWFGEAFSEIRADPGHFVRHTWRKLRLYFGHYEVPDNQSYDYFERFVSPMLSLPFPSYAGILPLALCGMALGWRSRGAGLLIGFWIAYSASVILFFNMSRYRLPVVPVMAVFAGHALVELVSRVRRRDLVPVVASAVFLVIAYPIVYMDVVEPNFATTHYNLAIRHIEDAEARRVALGAIDESDERRSQMRADLLASMQLAERELRRALELSPANRRMSAQLARLMISTTQELEADGRLEPAFEHASATCASFPKLVPAWLDRARLALALGRRDLAIEAYRQVVELSPGHLLAERELARLEEERRRTP